MKLVKFRYKATFGPLWLGVPLIPRILVIELSTEKFRQQCKNCSTIEQYLLSRALSLLQLSRRGGFHEGDSLELPFGRILIPSIPSDTVRINTTYFKKIYQYIYLQYLMGLLTISQLLPGFDVLPMNPPMACQIRLLHMLPR